jgi:hypothetical protein
MIGFRVRESAIWTQTAAFVEHSGRVARHTNTIFASCARPTADVAFGAIIDPRVREKALRTITSTFAESCR